MWSFVIALVHFISETFIYKTAKLGPGIISPLIVACKCFEAFLSDSARTDEASLFHFYLDHTHSQLRVLQLCTFSTTPTSTHCQSGSDFASMVHVPHSRATRTTRRMTHTMDTTDLKKGLIRYHAGNENKVIAIIGSTKELASTIIAQATQGKRTARAIMKPSKAARGPATRWSKKTRVWLD